VQLQIQAFPLLNFRAEFLRVHLYFAVVFNLGVEQDCLLDLVLPLLAVVQLEKGVDVFNEVVEVGLLLLDRLNRLQIVHQNIVLLLELYPFGPLVDSARLVVLDDHHRLPVLALLDLSQITIVLIIQFIDLFVVYRNRYR